MYFLSASLFFFIGLITAGLLGVAKNQGLAGGAIVLMYGIISGGVAVLISFFIAASTDYKTKIKINKVLAILLVPIIIFIAIRIVNTQQEESDSKNPFPQNESKTTTPVDIHAKTIGLQESKEIPFELGFFKPNFYEYPSLLLYNNPNLEKSIMEHFPADTIKFAKNEIGNNTIKTAPPYLVPEHMKMDYDLLLLKLKSIGEEFAEVVVNKTDGSTRYVNKNEGTILLWPEFLLTVHSVEFNEHSDKLVRIKPLDHASTILADFSFMRPILIRDNWMKVDLLGDDMNKIETGWIRWKKDGKLHINYSLFS